MIRTTAELSRILAGTALANAESLEIVIPQCGERALALRPPDGVELERAWEICRERVEEIGRWPLGSVCWSAEAESWSDRVREEDFFSRRFYREEAGASAGLPPEGVVAASLAVDLDAALERRADRAVRGRSFERIVEEELQTLERRVGDAPDGDRILALHRSGEIPGLGALQRWLLTWEATHVRPAWWRRFLPGDRYLEAFRESDYGDPVLILPPIRTGWESLAYLHFWGAGGLLGSAAAVALLRRWNEQFGAELIGHFGILLFFRVARPPSSLGDALTLAWEQELLAECTTILSGISTCHHARMLVGRDRWTLKDRP